jgi:hypothetical protein
MLGINAKVQAYCIDLSKATGVEIFWEHHAMRYSSPKKNLLD